MEIDEFDKYIGAISINFCYEDGLFLMAFTDEYTNNVEKFVVYCGSHEFIHYIKSADNIEYYLDDEYELKYNAFVRQFRNVRAWAEDVIRMDENGEIISYNPHLSDRTIKVSKNREYESSD